MPGSSADNADPQESALSPSWAPPRAPLPPHRLAKLANALGVSTPVPAIHGPISPSSSYASSPLPSHSAVSPSFDFRRSPTPSSIGSSAHTFVPSPQPSRYLLHVLPPAHLPHESDYTTENELLPPPPTASGYHAHFRRGILIPVYPTLQSQLNAIAKEYALPSTVGLILYLITSSPAANASMSLGSVAEEAGEPGPRISEDIWKHIWTRVLRAEREETPLSAVRAHGLGFGGPAAQSSPSLLQDVMSNSSPLRPLLSPMRTEAPRLGTPSPSTTASHSAISSRSGLDSPDSATSVSDSGNIDDIPLPGLTSPALIPILAKVEFDIDKRKATWYGRWKKIRRAQHAKRAESRLGFRSRAGSRAGDESGAEEDVERRPALELRLVGRLEAEASMPAHLRSKNGRLLGPETDDGYAQLQDSDEDEDEDATMKYGNGIVSGDPLADVFGTDAESWADLRAESQLHQKKAKNPNVVDLALDGAALSALPDPAQDGEERQVDDDAAEIAELLKRNSRPALSVAIPGSPPEQRGRSGSQGSLLSRKHIPPALDLAPSLPQSVKTAGPGTDESNSGGLAYLTEGPTPPADSESSDGETTQRPSKRSPLEEKRDAVLFDELNLGLEPSMEFDDDDPDDRRKSQVLMMAKLDEIERTLAQFSPRRLAIEDLAAETPTGMPSIASLSPPPPNRAGSTASTPKPSPQPGPPPEGASWPAVPYSMLNNMGGPTPTDSEFAAEGLPSPPRIAFNGISTELPKSPFQQRLSAADVMSEESLARKRELEEEQDALYPPLVAPSLLRHSGSDSPVIPLSPDPFGRFPSEVGTPPPRMHEESPFVKKGSALRQSHNNRNMSNVLSTPSSRFSIDSLASEEGKAVAKEKEKSLMSVKSIKKLWRRTNKSSVSGASSPALPESGRSSPNSAPGSAVPTGKRASRSQSRSPLPEQPRSAPGPAMLGAKQKSSQQYLHWNQESPYPIHPGPSPSPRTPSPAVPAMPPLTPPLPASAPPVPVQAEKGGVRKSILKSFKSQSGSLHSSSSSISRTSNEMPPPEGYGPGRRKPSVVELSSVMKRASGVSSTMTLVDIPRSPPLPDHLSGTTSRSASRQSQVSNSSARARQRPSISSTDSSSSRAPSRLVAGASPPRAGSVLSVPRTSGESYDSRPSFDESQFEIVSPKLAPSHTLSYPYTMDHSMSSAE